MRIATALAGLLLIAATAGAQTPPAGAPKPPAGAQTPPAGAAKPPQRRSTNTGSVSLAIMVTDSGGAPLGNVKVSLTTLAGTGGAAARAVEAAPREGRTEGGRLAFENLPAGAYRLRFDREGFVPLERELTARGAAPIEVKVTLTPAPQPPPPPPPAPAPAAPPPAAALSPDPLAIDMTAFIEKNYIGRADSKTSPLTCTTGGPAVLLQVKEGVADPPRPDADEFLYVIAGEGIGRAAGHDQPLRPGTFMMIPRGVARTLAAAGRAPLIVLSIRAGEKCAR